MILYQVSGFSGRHSGYPWLAGPLCMIEWSVLSPYMWKLAFLIVVASLWVGVMILMDGWLCV